MSGDRPPKRPEPGDTEEIDAVQRWVLPYFEDTSLWPVLLVVLAALIAFVSLAALFAVRDREPLGIVASGLLIVASVRAIRWEWQIRGRPGAIGVTLVVVWILAAGSAWYGARSGLL